MATNPNGANGKKPSKKKRKPRAKKKKGPAKTNGNGGACKGLEYIEEDQRERLIGMVRGMIGDGYRKHEFKAAIRKETRPDLHARTCEDIISRARSQVRLAASAHADDLIGELLEGFRACRRDPKASVDAKIRAGVAIAKLLGLNAPEAFNVKTTVEESADPASMDDLAGYTETELRLIAGEEDEDAA